MKKKNIQNPWAGLSSYEDPTKTKHCLKFCGRDNDTYDLTRLIDDNFFVTLYGKSGIGKTSLLNAGVFPMLRKERYIPLSLRLGMIDEEYSFQRTIIIAIENSIKECGGTINVIDVIDEQTNVLSIDYLWNYFARHVFKNAKGEIVFPVIVLDQFEEVFRESGIRVKNEILLSQLHYLIDENHALNDCIVSGTEYFYDFNFRFVLSIREDDLYRLEDSIDNCSLGALKHCRFRLRSLTTQSAEDVILIPGEGLFKSEESKRIVGKIIEISCNKDDNQINTNLLSLVCNRIYTEYQKRTDLTYISLSLVETFVKGNPFERFYNEATRGFSNREKFYIEDHFVDSTGRRNSIPENDFLLHVKKGNLLLQGDMRILQRTSISSDGLNYRIELLHDSFCEPLIQLKQKRKYRLRIIWLITFLMIILFGGGVILYINDLVLKNQTQKIQIISVQDSLFISNVKKDSVQLLLDINMRQKDSIQIQKDSMQLLLDVNMRQKNSIQIQKDSMQLLLDVNMRQKEKLKLKNDSLQKYINVCLIQEGKIKQIDDETSFKNILNEIKNEAKNLHEKGRTYLNEGKIVEGREYTKKAMDMRLQLFGEVNEDYITSLNNYANTFVMEENYSQSIELYKRVLELCNRLPNPHPNLGLFVTNMGRAFYLKGDKMEAAKYLNQALPLVEKKDELYEFLLEFLWLIYDENGDIAGREKIIGLIEDYNRHELEKECNEPDCMLERAQYFMVIGENTEAKNCFLKALGMPMNDAQKIKLYENYAQYHFKVNDFQSASEYQLMAAQLEEKANGRTEKSANLMYTSAVYSYLGGLYPQAIDCYQRVIDFYSSVNSTASLSYVTKCNMGIGNAYSAMKDYEKAKDSYQEVVAYYEAHDMADNEYPKAIMRLAVAEKFDKEYNASVLHHQQAMKLFKERNMMEDYGSAASSLNLCYAYMFSKEMYETFNVCSQLRLAVECSNMELLDKANQEFKKCSVNEFVSLRCMDETPLSLNGHFVFNWEFVDNLIAGHDVYNSAQRFAEIPETRGGKIFAKSCAVRKKTSVKYSFVSRGHQELAVVTEPGGMITLRIYDKTHNNWFINSMNVKVGQSYYCMTFDLPTDEKSCLEVEIINRTKEDISFVIISN